VNKYQEPRESFSLVGAWHERTMVPHQITACKQ
jgi:hypothetical protein